jgi:hypothetical protein
MNPSIISYLKNLKCIFVLLPLLTIGCAQAMEQPDNSGNEAQKIHDKIKIIACYAFMHHNRLVKENHITESRSNSNKTLVDIILSCAYDELCSIEKNNPLIWEDPKEIMQSFKQLTSKETIEINLDAYKSNILQSQCISTFLLYIAENSHSLKMRPTDLPSCPMFLRLVNQTHKRFFINGHIDSQDYINTRARIKAINT